MTLGDSQIRVEAGGSVALLPLLASDSPSFPGPPLGPPLPPEADDVWAAAGVTKDDMSDERIQRDRGSGRLVAVCTRRRQEIRKYDVEFTNLV